MLLLLVASLSFAQDACPADQVPTGDPVVPCCPPGQSLTEGACVDPPAQPPDPLDTEGAGTQNAGVLGTLKGDGPTAAGEQPTPGTVPIILGALDKSLIDAVIKDKKTRIRACYLRELRRDPTLEGRLVVKFVITRDGTVSSAVTKQSTLNNTRLEGCVNRVFLRLRFPEPKGGGIVIVSYPFHFSPH